MLEFLMERWGVGSLQDLMTQFRQGVSWRPALKAVTGLEESAFFELFLDWARTQIMEWGIVAEPTLRELLLEESRDELDGLRLAAERSHHLKMMRRAMRRPRTHGSTQAMVLPEEPAASIEDDQRWFVSWKRTPIIRRCSRWPSAGCSRVVSWTGCDPQPVESARIRPGDPLGHEFMASWWQRKGDHDRAAEAMRMLVAQEEYDPLVARRMARAMRKAGRFDAGADAMEKSVGISPYDPSIREEAAASAIEAGRFDAARRHLEALILIEPDQPVHLRRLNALQKLRKN